MRRFLLLVGSLALVALLVWSASKLPAVSPAALSTRRVPTPAETPGPPCEACPQATLAAALTQEQINLSSFQAQASATADIVRAHAVATANAVAATQGVAQTQENVDANALQAQAAATADILRAHTLATAKAEAATQSAAQAQAMANANALQAQAAATADILQAHTLATANAAAATQSAVQTQEKLNADVLQAQAAATAEMLQANTLATADAATATQRAVETEAVLQQSHRLQLTSGAATQSALAVAAQQKIDQTVSGTATAIAAGAFQARSDAGQRPGPGVLLWMWITPILIIVAAVLSLWGVSRWLAQRRNRGQSNTPMAMGNPPPTLMSNLPPVTIDNPLPPDSWSQPGDEPIRGDDPFTAPDRRQVRGWLEEVKHKLSGQGEE